MQSRINTFLAAMVIALGIALIAVTLSPPPPITSEQHNAAQQRAEEGAKQHDVTKSFRERLSIIWERTWDDPVAFYTFVLGIFTALLAVVSLGQIAFLIRADKTARTSADAAVLSAKAAIGVQLPIIRATNPGLIGCFQPPTFQDFLGGGVYKVGVPNERYSIIANPMFINSGRSKAYPFMWTIGWSVAIDLPQEPSYLLEISCLPTAIIHDDEERPYPPPRFETALELTDEQRTMLVKNEGVLWLYGSLHYRDFLNAPHEARFCWHFTNGLGFGVGGNSPTNYTTHK